MTAVTEVVNSNHYRVTIRHDDGRIERYSRPRRVLATLQTSDLDYALAYGRKRFSGDLAAERVS